MAFALLLNLYRYVRERTERRLCLAVLGVDGAGKTTLLQTVQGNLEAEVTPTMGFDSTETTTGALGLNGGRFTLRVFDLGGGRNIRRVWKSYLAEVHAVVFVVDAADATRLAECKQVLHETAGNELLSGKPILVFANKQDLPGAASAAHVAEQVGLSELRSSAYHIKACTAKTPAGQPPDARIKEGLEWLLAAVRQAYAELHPRVERDTLAAREEEARKKREREEKVRQIREERARQQLEQQRREEEELRLKQAAQGGAGGDGGDNAASAQSTAAVAAGGSDALPSVASISTRASKDGGRQSSGGGGGPGPLRQPNLLLAPLPGIVESPKPPGSGIPTWAGEAGGQQGDGDAAAVRASGGGRPQLRQQPSWQVVPQQQGAAMPAYSEQLQDFSDLQQRGGGAGALQPQPRPSFVRRSGSNAARAGGGEGEGGEGVRASGGGGALLQGGGSDGGEQAAALAKVQSLTRPNKVLPVLQASS